MSPQRTTCIYVGAESMLHFESASFSNSFKTDSSMHNNALLQCRYPTLGPKLCLEYPSNPVQINFLVTDTLTVCSITVRIPDIGTKALSWVPFESFTDQLLSDRYIDSKWFSFGPLYTCAAASVQVFKVLSWSRWCMCFVILPTCHICCIIVYTSLSRISKHGVVRGMLSCLDSMLLMILIFTHVFRSNMSYFAYNRPFERREGIRVILRFWHV